MLDCKRALDRSDWDEQKALQWFGVRPKLPTEPDSWARYQAVAALVGGGDAAVTQLIKGLQDPEPAIRHLAAEALGTLRESSAVPALIQALSDSEYWVRWKAAESLGRLRDARALSALVELLQSEIGVVVVKSGCEVMTIDLRAIAADALAELGDSRAIEPLIQSLGKREISHSVSRALQRLGYSPSSETTD
jgi:HEAT repeat protein